jgi:hypothetical protein
VLQGRLTIVVVAGAIVLTACAGADGTERGAIRENVVEPGITAIEQGRSETCGVNATALQTAIDSYTLLEGDPPADEAALVDAGLLREETTDWDVAGGVLVPENPTCGPVPGDAPVSTIEIVTEDVPLDADALYATFDRVQIDSVGGEACARELAEIIAGAEAFVADRAAQPADLQALVDAGYLDRLPTRWANDGDQLLPTDAGGCTDLG